MYRKVHCRMWRRGGSFHRLPGPGAPNAQHLWFYLLTGDVTSALPGVMVVDRDVLAAKLGWSKHEAAFDAAVLAIEAEHMAYFDWDAGMVWCPAALNYNKPQSPNVVKHWGQVFDLLPECKLKNSVLEAVGELIEELSDTADRRKPGAGETYREAFREAFPEAFLYVSDAAPAPARSRRPKIQPGDYDKDEAFCRLWEAYPNGSGKKAAHKAWLKARGEKRVVTVEEQGKRALKENQILVESLIVQVVERAASDRQWLKDGGEFVPHLSTFLNQDRWTDGWQPRPPSLSRVGDGSEWEPPWNAAEHKKYGEKAKGGEHPRWQEYFDHQYLAHGYDEPWIRFEDWLKERGEQA